MTPKPVDLNETYEVVEMFSCGEGHFLSPGFTHWEEGEACPHGHDPNASNEDVHLYYRKLLMPTTDSKGGSMRDYLAKVPGAWGQFPVAP